jgi:hypothetical protein
MKRPAFIGLAHASLLSLHACSPQKAADTSQSASAASPQKTLRFYAIPIQNSTELKAKFDPMAAHLSAELGVPVASLFHRRVLIHTGTFPDFEHWNSDFAGLDPALVDALAAQGIELVGVDTPSVDVQESKDLPAHARFLANDMSILEGLRLAHVAPGEYELIALPLPLVGFDASPVRAVLRTL